VPHGDNTIGPLDGRRHPRRLTDKDHTWVEEAEGWLEEQEAYDEDRWDLARKFSKRCDTCGEEIVLVQLCTSPAKWMPFNADRTPHLCRF
jgi:hypothetical protein